MVFLVFMATAINVQAQDEQPVPDETPPIEELTTQDPAEITPEAVEPILDGSEIDAQALEGEEPGLDTFSPSTEISADRSVAFPNDI
jgi:hypothetical protein